MQTPLSRLKAPLTKGPVLVVVLDGTGLGVRDAYDAVFQANTPCLDRLMHNSRRFTSVTAHGHAVGLPTDDDMGNSEVGHNALGCGRVVRQGAALVNDSLRSAAFFESETFEWLKGSFAHGKTLQLIGLLSDGGVHSRLDQLFKLVEGAVRHGAKRVRVHALLDGRDVPDHSAETYVRRTEKFLQELSVGSVDARIASGGGRMHVTMDRYESDWSVVERGWKAHVLGVGPSFASAQRALAHVRSEQPTLSDQYLPPFVVVDDGLPIGTVDDGDAVICFNYRGDRVIQLSRAFEQDVFTHFDRVRRPHVRYAGMMQYDGDLLIPRRYLVAPPAIDRTAGEYLVSSGVRIFACSETHKFGHVTYFWNGNRSGRFDETRETYVEIPSDPRAFVDAPGMRAQEIADATSGALRSHSYDFLRVNLANGDMVGHTGDLAATIRAVEAADDALARMLHAVDDVNGAFLVTADHGNADDMALRDKQGVPLVDKNGIVLPRTAHTLAPVPLCIGGRGLRDDVELRHDKGAGLANIAATYLNLCGFEAPSDYERSMVRFASQTENPR